MDLRNIDCACHEERQIRAHANSIHSDHSEGDVEWEFQICRHERHGASTWWITAILLGHLAENASDHWFGFVCLTPLDVPMKTTRAFVFWASE
jgi:hypothetical protein